jgi:hypothetical protein
MWYDPIRVTQDVVVYACRLETTKTLHKINVSAEDRATQECDLSTVDTRGEVSYGRQGLATRSALTSDSLFGQRPITNLQAKS